MFAEFEELRREVAELERAAAVAEGRSAAALERLRGEFGVESVEEAKALLDKLRKKERAAVAADDAARAAYLALREQHKDQIREFLGGSVDGH